MVGGVMVVTSAPLSTTLPPLSAPDPPPPCLRRPPNGHRHTQRTDGLPARSPRGGTSSEGAPAPDFDGKSEGSLGGGFGGWGGDLGVVLEGVQPPDSLLGGLTGHLTRHQPSGE